MGRKGGMKALLHKEVEKSQNWKKRVKWGKVQRHDEEESRVSIHSAKFSPSYYCCVVSTQRMKWNDTFTFIHSFKQANQKCLHVSENNTHALMHYVLPLLTEKAPHIPTPWVCASTEQQVGERKDEGSEGEKVSLFHMPLFLITSLPYTPLPQDYHFNCFYSSPPSSLFLPLPVCASRWPCDPVSFCAQQTKEPFEVQVLPRGTGRI